MSPRPGSWLVAAGLGLALLASACGAPTEQAAGAQSTEADRPAAEGAPATRQDPVRVLMAGDSLLADVAAALGPTLHDGGTAVTSIFEAPSAPRNDLGRLAVGRRLDRFRPDVVVVLIGVWEAMAIRGLATAPVGSAAWERTYRRQVLEPYVDLLGRGGAEVVWIGMPPVRRDRPQQAITAMNRVARRLADVDERLTFVRGDRLLATPSGGWTAFLPGPGGDLRRVRRVDTTHLCPEGVVRLARPVLDHLRAGWDVAVPANWPGGRWRWVFPPADCPPAR